MDPRLQAEPQLHYRLNGGAGRNSRTDDDALKFLSQEEQECLQFFEETIDSLEDSLEEYDQRTMQAKPTEGWSGPVEEVDGPLASSPNQSFIVPSLQATPPSPKDQDIIDLVRPEPDLVQTKEPIFNPTFPDFQSMVPTPESHFEIKPRHDPMDGLPSEYNPPLPSHGPTDSHSYHPPGSIPTPVLIAQKIAENQAAGTSNIQPSSLLRRCSLESDKPAIPGTDLGVKQGPPTSAKPTRFPANISVTLGNKEHQNQSLANVKVQERRAQMLANLTGSHPLLHEDPPQMLEQKDRNIPKRSISFKDPTPDKSRMEALSKLGLTRNRAMSSGVMSLPAVPNSTFLDPPTGAETSAKTLEVTVPPTAETSTKPPGAGVTTPHQSQINNNRKSETNSSKIPENKHPKPSPSPPVVTQNSYSQSHSENKAAVLPPPEVTSMEFNSYGGKTIVVNPSAVHRSEHATSPTTHEPKPLPPALTNPSELNNYGGKSKVMNPSPAAVTRSDLPDILSSHIDKSQTLPARSEPLPTEPNNYGGKSRTFNPSARSTRSSHNPASSAKAPAPTPAPRPPRHSFHGFGPSAAQRALSPEHKKRGGSLFRSQGITVQFSGRGATDESRREALRKLGLLKDS